MKQVIITIDTEGHDGIDPISHLIWGKTEQGAFGIDRIMDICDIYSAKVLFFVDIAEAWDYGKDKLAEVITHILNRGHNVGVHIHPDHMADKNRLFLWEYSKEEQFDIIKKCTDMYIEITGEQPLAFRAGKYGANQDTLDIINELGYKYDFSQFYGQKWCGINPPIAILLPTKFKNIIEVPVTIFRSFKLCNLRRYDKLDAVIDSLEFKHILNRIADDDRNIIVSLFYHSFSMLDWREAPDNPKLNKNEEKKFINAIKYVYESPKFEFVSLDELKKSLAVIKNGKTEDTEKNIITTKGVIRSFYFTLKRVYSIRKFNKKAKRLFLIIYFMCVVSILLIFITLLK